MGLCWILCLLLMLVSILSTGGVCPEYPVPKRADTTLHVAYLYQRITLGSLALCLNHCLRGTKCKSIAYTLTGECRLFTKSVEDDPSLATAEIGTLYVSRSRLHSVKHVCLSVFFLPVSIYVFVIYLGNNENLVDGISVILHVRGVIKSSWTDTVQFLSLNQFR